MKKAAILEKIRNNYHKTICKEILSDVKGYPNNADVSSKSSIKLAQGIIKQLNYTLCQKPPAGQTIGAKFSEITSIYLENAFKYINHLRQGEWIFSVSQARVGIAAFDQYQHLLILKDLMDKNHELASSIGTDYLIIPDIIIARKPVKDNEINKHKELINNNTNIANLTPLRISNCNEPCQILHASISCKWTIRSDRTQNTRTEALNLIRNRKGNTPHIVAVTAEPLPTRIAAIAMGTGDIDCVYHMALNELIDTAKNGSVDDQYEMLLTLVNGRRLRDISDLVFDLAI